MTLLASPLESIESAVIWLLVVFPLPPGDWRCSRRCSSVV